MTWREAIEDATARLAAAGLNDARLNAELLAAFILGGWVRGDVKEHLPKAMSEDELPRFSELVERRLSHEPLQHITGETEFFGLRLFSSPAALVPRPDTEILVEEALKELEEISHKTDSPRVIDIGTGSGAIILAIGSRFPSAACIGIDASPEALALAEKNRTRLELSNISFLRRDIFDITNDLGTFDLVVSNPPYIKEEEYAVLDKEVKDFEPKMALLADEDGFAFYQRIADVSHLLLRDNGSVLVETGFGMAEDVEHLMSRKGWRIARTVSDLGGIKRVIVMKKSS